VESEKSLDRKPSLIGLAHKPLQAASS